MLVSRDEQSCLVVSYREIKSCVESAFRCVISSRITDLRELTTLFSELTNTRSSLR